VCETSRVGLFITGTDTGVGKTAVTASVARLLRRQGRPVAVCKPVATGARRVHNGWLNEDTVQLAQAAGVPEEWARVTPWAFPDPVAPPLAARRQGVCLALKDLVQAVNNQAQTGKPVLVEGVGGLLCPLTEQATMADLARELGYGLVVVARRSLGTLNHTLLTLEVARRRGLRVVGVVVNATTPPSGLAEETAPEELRRLGVPVLATIPFCPQEIPAILPGLADIDWWVMCFSPGLAGPGEEEKAPSC
jgi:dethiobiotin synthetase